MQTLACTLELRNIGVERSQGEIKMQVFDYGHATGTVAPGHCVLFELGGKNIFAIAFARQDGEEGLFIFSEIPPAGPWVSYDRYPYSMFCLPKIELRPNLESLHFNSPDLGDLISADGGFFMRGSTKAGQTVTINLQTGLLETLPGNKPYASFSRWSAGIHLDGIWKPILDR